MAGFENSVDLENMLKISLLIWINLPFLQIFGDTFVNRLAYSNMVSNSPWSKFSSTQRKLGHLSVYCDFSLQKWWEAPSLALLSSLKTICFREVYFKAVIVGEPLKKYFQIFWNNLEISNFIRLPLSVADPETSVKPSNLCDVILLSQLLYV